MKRFLVALTLMMGLSACSQAQPKTLKVFNWGVYIDETLIKEFEEANKVTVIYDTFDSNETMYTKLLSGEKYDVLYPSDYMVQRLIDEGLLQTLYPDTLKGLESYLPSTLHQAYDVDNVYSVPYFWGNVGILYDATVVSEKDVQAGWNVLLNPTYKGKIYFYDSERDAFMVALKALGYSANTKDENELHQAYEWLRSLNATMDPVYVTDDVIDNMIAGNKALAVVYSGDAAYILEENENMRYFAPQEGTNIWIDSMVVPQDAANPELANAWIQFMMSADAAKRNTLEVGYTTVRSDVYEDMLENDYNGNEAYAVRMNHPHDEVFEYNEVVKHTMSDLWLKVKAQ